MTTLLIALTVGYSTIMFRSYVTQSLNHELVVTSRDITNEMSLLRSLALDQVRAISYRSSMSKGLEANDRAMVKKAIDDYETMRKCDYFTILDATQKQTPE